MVKEKKEEEESKEKKKTRERKIKTEIASETRKKEKKLKNHLNCCPEGRWRRRLQKKSHAYQRQHCPYCPWCGHDWILHKGAECRSSSDCRCEDNVSDTDTILLSDDSSLDSDSSHSSDDIEWREIDGKWCAGPPGSKTVYFSFLFCLF